MQAKNFSEEEKTLMRISDKCTKYLNLFCGKFDLDKRNRRVKKMEDKLHLVFERKVYDAREIIKFSSRLTKMYIEEVSHEFGQPYYENGIKSDLSLNEQEKNIDNLIMREYIYRIIIVVIVIIILAYIFI